MSFIDYSEPKNGRSFRILGFDRISTPGQDELSLDDQGVYGREHLERLFKNQRAKFEYTSIASQGSGQYVDREEFLKLCEMVETGEFDIVVAEDLGRILRRVHAFIFCEASEDSATRVIAINDFVDTSEDNWRQNAFFAAFKHESFCRETSQRIRRSHRNRFNDGGIFQFEIYGYVKPHAKAKDSEVTKDPVAEDVYDQWFTMLEGDENGENFFNYREVADWLNGCGVPTGKHCSKDEWDGPMVRRYTFNPMLKGERRRNDRVTIRINKTGRPKTISAPEEHKLSRQCPNLIFIEPERFDRVKRKLEKRNAKYKRAESVVNDPRAGIPKRQTRWPGQHIRCGVCGRLFVFGGHGRKERLMCNGAREHKCWNAMTISGPGVARAVGDHIRELTRELPEFDALWVAEFEAQRDSLWVEQSSELSKFTKQLEAKNRELENYIAGLGQVGTSEAIVKKIRETEDNVNDLRDEIYKVEQRQQDSPVLPTLEEIQEVANEAFGGLVVGSEEFARLMRTLVDEFFVLPYRLADGGEVQPRVIFRASVGKLISPQHDLPILQFDRIVDLAKRPRRLRYLEQVVRMVGEGRKHKDIGEQLGIFKTEVSYAMRLHRCMIAQATADPWIPITSSDQVYDCYKRVRNPRFKFEPLDGFERTRHPEC